MSRTLAITGGTGFVGQTLLRLAVERGFQVRALARRAQPEMAGVEWVDGALHRAETLQLLAAGSDAVIHVAGVVNAPGRAGFEAGNVGGTLAMVEAARDAGVERFIHVSSLSAREPGLSDYGWSKARAETIVRASGLDWTIVRPPWVYGPGDSDTLDLFKAAKWGVVPVPPAGRVSVIEVSDLARLLLALIDAPEARARVYEADDGVEGGWSHADFARAIGAAVGKSTMPLAMPRRLLLAASKLDRAMRGKSAKLTADRVAYFCHPDWVVSPDARPDAELWMPQVETRQGLKATAEAYREAGWL